MVQASGARRKDPGENAMRVLKVIVIVAVVYVGIVALFESLLGYFQPTGDHTIVITTTDGSGHSADRVLSRLDSNGQLYVAANHWPRAWYHQALANPDVQVTIDDETADYRAVRVTDEEHARLQSEHALGPVVRILTGFPPRYFIRLDPQ
jgi:hypothetical protein